MRACASIASWWPFRRRLIGSPTLRVAYCVLGPCQVGPDHVCFCAKMWLCCHWPHARSRYVDVGLWCFEPCSRRICALAPPLVSSCAFAQVAMLRQSLARHRHAVHMSSMRRIRTQHLDALAHLPPPREAKRNLNVEAPEAAAGSKNSAGAGDKPSVDGQAHAPSAVPRSEACDASGSRVDVRSVEEPAGGAGGKAKAAPVPGRKTGQGAAQVMTGEEGLRVGGSARSGEMMGVIDEAIDHEKFTQLAKQQPGWAQSHDCSQHVASMDPASDWAHVGAGPYMPMLLREGSCASWRRHVA